jgi:transketolase
LKRFSGSKPYASKVNFLSSESQNGPTMIEVKTIIGYGAPNVSGTNGVHGAPLGSDFIDSV